ncbi:acetoin utilization protein AcuB [Desulfovibrionales bacterium]
MLIHDWMTRGPIITLPDVSMMKVAKIMKEKNIRRLPVVDQTGRLVGIITDRDIKEASPSKATTLDVHELYYLLSEIKVKDIMTKDPIAVNATDTVETAALIMTNKRLGSLPVIDEHNKVIGIITDSDVFKVLIDITGVKHGGVQLGLELPNQTDALKQVIEDLTNADARIMSILTNIETLGAETRQAYIRIMKMERSLENKIVEEIKNKYKLIYWARDRVHPLT